MQNYLLLKLAVYDAVLPIYAHLGLPALDLKSTGNKIKSLRIESIVDRKCVKKKCEDLEHFFSIYNSVPAVRSIAASRLAQNIPRMFCRLKPSLPMFDATIEEIVVSRMVEVEITCSSDKVEKPCSRKCDGCKFKLSA